MKKFLKSYLPIVYKLLIRVKSVFLLFLDNKCYISANSYFPEMGDRRLSKLGIFWRQFKHVIKCGYPNDFFFLYGLDIKNFHKDSDYVDYMTFMSRRDYMNRLYTDAPINILRNKFLFGITANALNIPTPHNIGIIEYNRLYLMDTHQYVDLKEYFALHVGDVFMKSTNGECADGVYHLIFNKGNISIDGVKSTYDELLSITKNDKYIIQEKIKQIKALSDLHPDSINTIRVETVYNKRENKIEILPPLLRVGTKKHNVDNWAVGGFAIGIDVEKGCLREYGFYKPAYGTKAYVHPDTNIVFAGYEIPYLSEAIDMAVHFHSYFTDIHSIGWDIAITEDGPCFVEGNDNWEISLVQVCSRGLMPEFSRLFY